MSEGTVVRSIRLHLNTTSLMPFVCVLLAAPPARLTSFCADCVGGQNVQIPDRTTKYHGPTSLPTCNASRFPIVT